MFGCDFLDRPCASFLIVSHSRNHGPFVPLGTTSQSPLRRCFASPLSKTTDGTFPAITRHAAYLCRRASRARLRHAAEWLARDKASRSHRTADWTAPASVGRAKRGDGEDRLCLAGVMVVLGALSISLLQLIVGVRAPQSSAATARFGHRRITLRRRDRGNQGLECNVAGVGGSWLDIEIGKLTVDNGRLHPTPDMDAGTAA